jgi:hypothetical protein
MAIQHPFDLSNMRFAIALVRKLDVIKGGGDVFMVRP